MSAQDRIVDLNAAEMVAAREESSNSAWRPPSLRRGGEGTARRCEVTRRGCVWASRCLLDQRIKHGERDRGLKHPLSCTASGLWF